MPTSVGPALGPRRLLLRHLHPGFIQLWPVQLRVDRKTVAIARVGHASLRGGGHEQGGAHAGARPAGAAIGRAGRIPSGDPRRPSQDPRPRMFLRRSPRQRAPPEDPRRKCTSQHSEMDRFPRTGAMFLVAFYVPWKVLASRVPSKVLGGARDGRRLRPISPPRLSRRASDLKVSLSERLLRPRRCVLLLLVPRPLPGRAPPLSREGKLPRRRGFAGCARPTHRR